ncbi:MAG TPA: adenosine deaminase [Gaiellaceae bacterium]|nr:adenosine deaminase [Gaiellaceae bacterium]
MSELAAFIEGMPKAELHLHLEGTLEPELKFELAARNGLDLPYASVDEMRAAYAFDDLPSFLAVYYEGMSVLLREPDFYDLATAYFRKAHSQNVVYAEVFFDPQAHTSRGIPFETAIEGLRRAQQDAEASLGLRSRLIMCFLRDMSADSALETLEQSLPYRDWIVGVGLDSDEKGNPPVKFKDVFARARAEGYRLTMHCDVDQEDSVGHIWQCLDEIGVERIDHGVNALEDAALVREIERRGLGLTVCPISNSYVAGGLKATELKHMLDHGMRATVNSDDPAYFPGYVNENVLAAQAAAGLTREEVVALARNAFTVSWAEPDERVRYLDALDAYAAAY